MRDYTKDTSRTWHIICYDMLVVKAITEKATRYAYILHDRDKHEDGTPKPPHFHVYVYRRNDTKGSFFVNLGKKTSPDNGNVRVAVQTNGADAVQYFQHADDESKVKGKTLYPLSEVVFDSKGNDDHFLTLQEREAKMAEKESTREANNLALLNDLLVYRNNKFQLAKRYGMSFICNLSKLMSFADALLFDENLPLDELSDAARECVLHEREEKNMETPPSYEYGEALWQSRMIEEMIERIHRSDDSSLYCLLPEYQKNLIHYRNTMNRIRFENGVLSERLVDFEMRSLEFYHECTKYFYGETYNETNTQKVE